MKISRSALAFAAGILFSVAAIAQAPQAFKYQSVVRNISGGAMVNTTISVRASIHDGAANGPVVYQETFAVTTNGFGLINLEIPNQKIIELRGMFNEK